MIYLCYIYYIVYFKNCLLICLHCKDVRKYPRNNFAKTLAERRANSQLLLAEAKGGCENKGCCGMLAHTTSHHIQSN